MTDQPQQQAMAAAMKAANALVLISRTHALMESTVAAIIVAETGLPGLIEACQFAATGHNLLAFMGTDYKCECDADVGMVPCMGCAAKQILRKLDAALAGAGVKA